MRGVIIITTIIMGIGGLGVWPSMGGVIPLSPKGVSFGLMGTQKPNWQIDQAGEPTYGFYRFFIQRKSSSPPGESTGGRASSNEPGRILGSSRSSSRSLDLTESKAHRETFGETQKAHRDLETDPHRSRDSLDRIGGGQSPPASTRRGGVRK